MVDSTLVFKELEHDFLQYMLHKGGIAKKTSHDYISRMRFLSNSYVLDSNGNYSAVSIPLYTVD